MHAYWVLDVPVSKEQAEIGNRRLALALGADPAATDAARVLRPPGTFNHKPDHIVDGEPAPVRLCTLTDTRYAWDEVVGALPDPTEQPRKLSPQGWYCFACRKGGGIIEFAALLYGIEPRGADYRKLRQRIAAGLRGEST